MPTASLPQALSVFAEATTPHLSPPHPSPLLSLFITAKQVMFLICWHRQCTVRRFRPWEWSIPWMIWLGPSLLVPFSFLWWNILPAPPGQRFILTHGLRHAGHDGGGTAAEVWRDWSQSLKPGSRELTGNRASCANPRLAPLPTSSKASPYTSTFTAFHNSATRWGPSIQTPEHLGDVSQSNHLLCGLKPAYSKLA